MITARVVGEVVATIKHEHLTAHKLLLVQPIDPAGNPKGQPMLGVDVVDAGVGDRVLVVDEGNSAAQVLQRPRGAIRTVVVGVIDEIETPERTS
jgi:ethanolamine utilization protein EutN